MVLSSFWLLGVMGGVPVLGLDGLVFTQVGLVMGVVGGEVVLGVVGGEVVFLVGLDVSRLGEYVLGGGMGLLGVLGVSAHDRRDEVVHVALGLGVFAVVGVFLQDRWVLGGLEHVLVGFEPLLDVLQVPLVLVLLASHPLFVHGTVLPQFATPPRPP